MPIKTILDLSHTQGRILGVDFGDVRTGLAVSDINRFLASGIGYISVGGLQKTAERTAEIAEENHVTGVVVGLPKNMDGSEGFRADRVQEFASVLSDLLGDNIIVTMFDERMTTMSASRFLNETNTRGSKRKTVIDTLSAQIILQNALDRIKYMNS